MVGDKKEIGQVGRSVGRQVGVVDCGAVGECRTGDVQLVQPAFEALP